MAAGSGRDVRLLTTHPTASATVVCRTTITQHRMSVSRRERDISESQPRSAPGRVPSSNWQLDATGYAANGCAVRLSAVMPSGFALIGDLDVDLVRTSTWAAKALMTSSATPRSASIVQKVWRSAWGGAAILAHAGRGYPQLYSRIGFAHRYKPLSTDELRFVLAHHWQRFGLALCPADFTDAEAIPPTATSASSHASSPRSNVSWRSTACTRSPPKSSTPPAKRSSSANPDPPPADNKRSRIAANYRWRSHRFVATIAGSAATKSS
jgi:hypothetical protein